MNQKSKPIVKHDPNIAGIKFGFAIAEVIFHEYLYHDNWYIQQKELIKKLNMSKQLFYQHKIRKLDQLNMLGIIFVKEGKEVIVDLDIHQLINYLIGQRHPCDGIEEY